MVCCFTGYRPAKFPFELKSGVPEYEEFLNRLHNEVSRAIDEGCDTFYFGGAQGFDIIAAEAVLSFRNFGTPRLIAAVPYPGQANGFPDEWKKRYNTVMEAADEVITVCPAYFGGCFEKRNRYMVDRSDRVITFFDGASGGTKNTVEYARKKGREVVNLFNTQLKI